MPGEEAKGAWRIFRHKWNSILAGPGIVIGNSKSLYYPEKTDDRNGKLPTPTHRPVSRSCLILTSLTFPKALG